MLRKLLTVCAGLGFLTLATGLMTGPAWANDQNVVIGAGLGVHSFANSDDARQGNDVYNNDDELDTAGMSELYGEWYALGNLGFGIRYIGLAAGRTYTYYNVEVKQEVAISSLFATAQFILFGGESYARFGVYGGLGSSTYEAKETVSGTGSGDYSESGSVTGPSTLAGAFLDWGAEDFGARFGVHAIQMTEDELEIGGNTLTVDGSGTSVYFDLRWAF